MSRPQLEEDRDRTYDPDFFAHLFAVEDQHFWFRIRNRVIANLFGQVARSLPAGCRVLEVGCGTGNVLRILEATCPAAEVIGLDQSAEGLRFARRRTSCELIRGDVRDLRFDAPFDVIGLFDVLEHVPDDGAVLTALWDRLRPGGALLLTVPAQTSLWSYFDEASGHCRRYELDDLRRKLIDSGYRVEFVSHYMATIFPLMWLVRRFTRVSAGRQREAVDLAHTMALRELRVLPGVNAILTALLSWEPRLLARRQTLRLGASLIAIARR